MKLLKSSLLVVALSSSFAFAESTLAATDIYLNLDQIPGESTNSRHRNEIVLLSYSQSVQANAVAGGGGARSPANAVCGQISFQKQLDKSSEGLVLATFTGKHITQGIVTFENVGANGAISDDYYKVTLNDLTVTSVQQSDSSPNTFVENVTLHANKIRIDYHQQLPNGSIASGETITIDCTAG